MKAYQIGLYEKAMPGTLTWREKLELAREAGYDYIEISIDETEEKLKRLSWSMEERLALIMQTKETGVAIGSMCLSGHRRYPLGSHDAATAARSMEIMEQAIGLASDLGIRTIQLAGYDVYYEESDGETVRRFRENLKKAAELAAAKGISMGFETMETEFMNTTKKAMEYVREIHSPYLGVYPDLGNLTNAAVSYGTDVLEDLAAGEGHLLAMHLKETVPGVFREVPFGTGHVNFSAGIQTAWKLGVRRYVTELWYAGNENWRDAIFKANKMMTEILDEQERQ